MTEDYRAQVDAVYTRAYDNAYFLGYQGEYGQQAGIAAGVYAVAEWARKETLLEIELATAASYYDNELGWVVQKKLIDEILKGEK